MEDIKLCKDCRWFCDPNSLTANFPVCGHEKSLIKDLVRGNHRHGYCDAMRIYSCGPEGKLWEPRQ